MGSKVETDSEGQLYPGTGWQGWVGRGGKSAQGRCNMGWMGWDDSLRSRTFLPTTPPGERGRNCPPRTSCELESDLTQRERVCRGPGDSWHLPGDRTALCSFPQGWNLRRAAKTSVPEQDTPQLVEARPLLPRALQLDRTSEAEGKGVSIFPADKCLPPPASFQRSQPPGTGDTAGTKQTNLCPP